MGNERIGSRGLEKIRKSKITGLWKEGGRKKGREEVRYGKVERYVKGRRCGVRQPEYLGKVR